MYQIHIEKPAHTQQVHQTQTWIKYLYKIFKKGLNLLQDDYCLCKET